MLWVDSHVHVWTDELSHYPLAPGIRQEEMEMRRFLPSQISTHCRPSGVEKIVLIQMSYYGTDNRYMLDVIRTDPDILRGVAIVDPACADLPEMMLKLRAAGVRGFRIQMTDPDWTPLAAEEKFGSLFGYAAEREMSICPLIGPANFPILSRLCERFSQTCVVVDHMGRIGFDGIVRQEEVAHLCALSMFPQVYVKISAFYALGNKQPPHLDLADMIQRVYDAFGPRRLMWGSDSPFQILSEPYECSISLVRDHLTFLSPEDKEWILGKTAEQVFF